MSEGFRSVQVLIAAMNEEEGIGPTIAELSEYLGAPRILVVDGKSMDRTVEIAKNNGAEVFCQEGVGKGDAIARALECADLSVDYVVLADADYTHPAEYRAHLAWADEYFRKSMLRKTSTAQHFLSNYIME